MAVSPPGVSLGAGVIEAWPGREGAGTALAEVVTGEAVVLEVPCARFPSRLLALALDLFIQVILLFILFVIVGLAITGDRVDSAAGGAIALTVSILIVVGYPVLWETLTRGGSPASSHLACAWSAMTAGRSASGRRSCAGWPRWWRSGSCSASRR